MLGTRKEFAMKIIGIVEIHDNDEYVTFVLASGSNVHLPKDKCHSIVILDSGKVHVALFQG